MSRTTARILHADAIAGIGSLESGSVALTVTSPPYFGQRDYGVDGQFGREASVEEYIDVVRRVLGELFRVTDERGVCFWVIGDTYRNRRLQLVPHRTAIAAHEVGWTVRNDLIWSKSDAAPESVKNRWRGSHEHVLFLSRRPSGYRFDLDPIRVPHAETTLRRWGDGQQYGGRKSRERPRDRDSRMRNGSTFHLHPKGGVPPDVWNIATTGSRLGHYATFPEEIVRRAVLACTEPGDLVLDPFVGSGTTCIVARQLGRRAVGIELNSDYAQIAARGIDASVESLH